MHAPLNLITGCIHSLQRAGPTVRTGTGVPRPCATQPGRAREVARALVGASLAIACLLVPGQATAQSDNPAPDWDPPYCEFQPRVTSVYDNDVPLYRENGKSILYSGVNVAPCGMGYDGHSGFDYARGDGDQDCGGRRPGQGYDLVYAATDGVVRRSRWTPNHETSYGLYIDIASDGGSFGPLSHLYGHLAAVFVDEGESVSRGQPIGALGTIGNSTGPHLHFQSARGPTAEIYNDTLDPYGWNAEYGRGYRYPGYPQPHRGDSWPMRVLQPQEEGPSCPTACITTVIDDDDPSVVYGCEAGTGPSACPYWYEHPEGYGRGHHWTYPNGATRDYYVRYSCPTCWPGEYLVEVYIPLGKSIANTHVATYRTAWRTTIVDQHEEGGLWHPIGVHRFASTPYVELNDRSQRYDFTDSAPRKLGADAVRFRRTCRDLGVEPPIGHPRSIDPPVESDGG